MRTLTTVFIILATASVSVLASQLRCCAKWSEWLQRKSWNLSPSPPPCPTPLPATQKKKKKKKKRKKKRRRKKTEEECSGAVESCCGWTVPRNMLYCVTQKLQGYSSRGMSSNNLYREESSVEFKMVSKRSEKIMCSTQSVRSFPGVSEEVSPCD